ncbi:unnamed protein product [Prorocentrum cordatum]|uniref:Uncharacterized protein n=1 Tax=Prorocentrum cordatum TaxID=2364126 RepID=A0ABN9XY30_9DINO|nr:unnamed protein product [Polarella glacialis]
MREAKLEPDASGFRARIGALGRSGQWQRAQSLSVEMRETTLEPGVSWYNLRVEVARRRRRRACLAAARAEDAGAGAAASGARLGRRRVPAAEAAVASARESGRQLGSGAAK